MSDYFLPGLLIALLILVDGHDPPESLAAWHQAVKFIPWGKNGKKGGSSLLRFFIPHSLYCITTSYRR